MKEDRRSFMFQELFIGSIYLGILIPITRETLNKSQNQTLYGFFTLLFLALYKNQRMKSDNNLISVSLVIKNIKGKMTHTQKER